MAHIQIQCEKCGLVHGFDDEKPETICPRCGNVYGTDVDVSGMTDFTESDENISDDMDLIDYYNSFTK